MTYVSQDNVRTHVKHMRRRLEARDRVHAVARAYSLGILAILTAEPTDGPAADAPSTARVNRR